MKTFIIALLVLLILICSIFSYCSYLKEFEKSLTKMVDGLSIEIDNQNWDNSHKKYEEIQKKWDENEGILAMFNDHGELDEIKLSLGELKESIMSKNTEHARKAVTETKIFLERLKKNETLNLENILKSSHNIIYCHIML